MNLKELRAKLTETAISPSQQGVNFSQNLTYLVRSGAIKTSELPTLKVAIRRHQQVGDLARLPSSQRTVLTKYYDATNNAVNRTRQSATSVRRNYLNNSYSLDSENEVLSENVNSTPPPMLILKRKAIRAFPSGEKVALYSCDRLGMDFTVPYSNSGAHAPVGQAVKEEVQMIDENLDVLKKSMETQKDKMIRFKDGTNMKVHPQMASALVQLHGALNSANKTKMLGALTHSKRHFTKLLDFAARNSTWTINK